jgi:dTDP-4-dehydrorhamnose 3,5-epimerase
MNSHEVLDTTIQGVKLFERKYISDDRGFLDRIFCRRELARAGWVKPVAQINHTYTSKKGTVRGMHYQRSPAAEMKLISCVKGEVWDVAVDLREGSPTFLNWHAEILTESNGRALLIPEGFAHGFQTISDDVELIYCHSEYYSPKDEGGINPTDSILNIKWPSEIMSISSKDLNKGMISPNFRGLIQ